MRLKSDLGLMAKVVATYIGAVIGAGFASGQEIMQFFIVFGPAGMWGVILATILFAYLGALIMFLAVRFRCTNYRELFNYLLGPAASKIMDGLSLLMLAGGLGVMLAGSGAVFSEQLGLPSWSGSVATAALTCLVVTGSLQGVLMANVILVPVKIVVIIFVTLAALFFHGTPSGPLPVEAPGPVVAGNWIWSAVLYVSYNMIVPVAVLSSLGRSITPMVAVWGGVWGGIGLGIAAGLITLAGLAFYPMVLLYEIPLLYIAGHLGEGIRIGLSVLIWLAILTTAIANAHGFASRLAPELGVRYRIVGLAIVGASFSLSGLDFSFLVSTIYPLFGYAGLILLAALIMVPAYRWLRFYH
ncbi:MAG: hypothetical protein AB1815_04845 [Bacillota bacterium]